jgi:hypothetical protein
VIREFAPQSTTVYINYEQSQKPANDNELEQGRIHNAFRTPPRTFDLSIASRKVFVYMTFFVFRATPRAAMPTACIAKAHPGALQGVRNSCRAAEKATAVAQPMFSGLSTVGLVLEDVLWCANISSDGDTIEPRPSAILLRDRCPRESDRGR